jgi:rhodanese-related sulfurtransferase
MNDSQRSEACVPATRNSPLSRFQQSLGDGPIGRIVFVVCASGGSSSSATVLLSGDGYDAVNVMSGITQWYRNGNPVTCTAGEQ